MTECSDFVFGVVVVNGGANDTIEAARGHIEECSGSFGDGDIDSLCCERCFDGIGVVCVYGEGYNATALFAEIANVDSRNCGKLSS